MNCSKDNKLKANAWKRIAEELACDGTTENYIHCFGAGSKPATRLIPKTSLPPRSSASTFGPSGLAGPPGLCPVNDPLLEIALAVLAGIFCLGLWGDIHRDMCSSSFFLNCDSGASCVAYVASRICVYSYVAYVACVEWKPPLRRISFKPMFLLSLLTNKDSNYTMR